MSRPSPRWRVQLRVHHGAAVVPRYDNKFDVSAQKARTAVSRVIGKWQHDEAARINRKTELRVRVWRISEPRRAR